MSHGWTVSQCSTPLGSLLVHRSAWFQLHQLPYQPSARLGLWTPMGRLGFSMIQPERLVGMISEVRKWIVLVCNRSLVEHYGLGRLLLFASVSHVLYHVLSMSYYSTLSSSIRPLFIARLHRSENSLHCILRPFGHAKKHSSVHLARGKVIGMKCKWGYSMRSLAKYGSF